MVKSVVGGALALVVLASLAFGWDTWSYLRLGMSSLRAAAKAEVPIEVELARARQLVDELVPEVRRSLNVVAEQQVDLERLEKGIADKKGTLASQKEALLTLRKDLAENSGVHRYASHTYTRQQVEQDLARRFERFRSLEAASATDEQILAARQQTLRANEAKLAALLTARQELQLQLEQLQARLETQRAQEAATTIVLDDSRLNQTKQLISQLNRQLDVRQKVLNQADVLAGEIPVEGGTKAEPADLLGEIDRYFSQPASAEVSANSPEVAHK